MKVFTEIQELIGKKVFRDSRLEKLKERFDSPKVSFVSVEFTDQIQASFECIVARKDKILDLVLGDIERAELLSAKVENKEIINKVLAILNKEEPICGGLEAEELFSIREYAFITAKPIVIYPQGEEQTEQKMQSLLQEMFQKANHIFFFTTNKKESRAWLIEKGIDIVTAASKIHTDLAKGFIRAEVYNVSELDNFKNLEEAKQKGILKIVDRDYIVEDGDVVNIKFSVNK